MRIVRPGYLLLLAGLTLSGCGRDDAEAPPADPAEEFAAPVTGEVLRAPAAPPPEPPPPAPDEAVIQTQEGSPGHVHVDLTRAQVTGDILMVQFRFRNTSDNRHSTVRFAVDEVNYIDDASARRYGVLVDEAGAPMASPLRQEDIVINLPANESRVAWFRFAAPEAGAGTISLSVPGVGPFDGIPVSR